MTADSDKKRVLSIVRTYCAPDVRVERETRSLVRAGYDVETFCLWDQSLPRVQEWAGGKIHRIVHVPMKYTRSIPLKIWSLCVFVWIVLLRGRGFDIIHCNDLDMLPIGVMVKAITFGRVKIVYDAHEYETERFHHDGIVKRLAKIVERMFIRFADETMTVSESIADAYVDLYAMRRPDVVLNCPEYKKATSKDLFRKNLGISKDKTIFLYQGGISPNRGIEMILDAFRSSDDPSKVVVFMGFGGLVSMVQQAAEKSDNIFYHDSVSTDVLLDYTASADVGILYYENTCLNHYYCSPNKLFEYTVAELPVVVSNLYELNRFVSAHGNGVVTATNDAQGLADAVAALDDQVIATLKENTRKIVDGFTWEAQERKFLDVYARLT